MAISVHWVIGLHLVTVPNSIRQRRPR